MDEVLDQEVRRRARNCCEYCHLPQAASSLAFTIDHIIARQHGGPTVLENLALACGYCNRHKGPNIAGVDPQSGRITPLFHPRRHRWRDHFHCDGVALGGVTPRGRTTVAVLAMNDPARAAIRQALIEEGLWPPEDDQ